MKRIIISLDVATDKDLEAVQKAIEKGIYLGLDTYKVAAPDRVTINYCRER